MNRKTLVYRICDCLPPYRVSWWINNTPQQRTFLDKKIAIKFYNSLET